MGINLHRKLTLDVLAGAAYLSTSRLRHSFKAEVGLTPTQYLQRLRMERAKELLETTRLSVKEIRSRVGFSGDSHFVNDFRRAFGVSPARYRARRVSLLPEVPPARVSHFVQ
jgi:AraC-like DNA-binding protein